MKIGIVVGSTRPGRIGTQVGDWVFKEATQRNDAEYELVDVADYDLDLLNEPTVPGAADRDYENPKTRVWGAKIDELDGFVWVTPEYNHGVPAAMKNAFDVLYPEWSNKSVGFVGYGAEGGVRAVEQWRQIVANASMVGVRAQVPLSLFLDFEDGSDFKPQDRRAEELSGVLDQVVAMADLLRSQRDAA